MIRGLYLMWASYFSKWKFKQKTFLRFGFSLLISVGMHSGFFQVFLRQIFQVNMKKYKSRINLFYSCFLQDKFFLVMKFCMCKGHIHLFNILGELKYHMSNIWLLLGIDWSRNMKQNWSLAWKLSGKNKIIVY